MNVADPSRSDGVSAARRRTPRHRKRQLLASILIGFPSAVIAASPHSDPALPGIELRSSAAREVASGEPRSSATFHVGDKIQLAFFERLDDEEDKWRGAAGRSAAVPRAFHQRTELSGEYVVQEDGMLSLPIIGSFKAGGETAVDLRTAVLRAFEALVERKGYVNILAVAHAPILITGAVKAPGSFKYRPGMTALHAVALAGGLRRKEMEPWQRVESGREMERLQKSLDRVKRLLARSTVLQAERSGDRAGTAQLASFAGKRYASSLVGEEEWQRSLTGLSRGAQETAMSAAVANARSELTARMGRMAPLEENIRLRSERVQSIRQLVEKNLLARSNLIQAQSELSDVEDRRRQVVLETEAAKKRLAEAERELNKHKVENSVELARSIANADREIVEAVSDSEGILDVVRTLAATQEAADADGSLIYEVIRRTSNGTAILNLGETAPLEPGDLVRVRSAEH